MHVRGARPAAPAHAVWRLLEEIRNRDTWPHWLLSGKFSAPMRPQQSTSVQATDVDEQINFVHGRAAENHIHN